MTTTPTRLLAAALAASALLATPLLAADAPAAKKDKPGTAAPAAAPAAGVPTTDDEQALYGIGLAISQNLTNFNLTEADLKLIQAGLSDGVLGREPKVSLETCMPKIQPFAQARQEAAAAGEKKKGEAYLAKMAKEPGAKSTSSGILMFEVKPGTGASPKASDTVKVHYTGRLVDGTVFDSSVEKGEPATFPLDQVVSCWTEALQIMKVGGKAKIVCPTSTAWADRGFPPKIAPGAAVEFDVELLGIEAPAAASPEHP